MHQTYQNRLLGSDHISADVKKNWRVRLWHDIPVNLFSSAPIVTPLGVIAAEI